MRPVQDIKKVAPSYFDCLRFSDMPRCAGTSIIAEALSID